MLEPGSRVLALLLFAVAATISTYADPCPNSISATQVGNAVEPPLVTPGKAADAWPPVPKEDQARRENVTDPGSAAMILEREVYTDDEERVQTELLRIKVLTEAGRAYADIEIPYVVKSTSVENIRGRTVQPDGTVIPFAGVIFDKVVAKYKRHARYSRMSLARRHGCGLHAAIRCHSLSTYQSRWRNDELC
jgi:uncharacterized protein DUF3857